MTPISDDMVERAAKALASARGQRDLEHQITCTDGSSVSIWRFYIDEASAALTAALEGSVAVPADKPCFHDEVVFLRELDSGSDNACWVICNRIDPGAVAFFRGLTLPRQDRVPTTQPATGETDV